ncbi:MAG: hypothetical protein C4539_10505 [Ignavibacteriales bacterium]|nr:MAG: hypothetical protein C4539_10505 [Ignavibacteriales bacterium]
MERTYIIEELKKEVELLNRQKLKEVFNFVKYLKNRERLDPTLEILSDENDYKTVKKGLKEKKERKLLDWEDVK